MKPYKITPSNTEDLDFACYLFDEAIAYQKRKAYPQYRTNDRPLLAEEIREGRHYKLLIEEEIAIMFSLCFSDKVTWRKRDKKDAIYLHRVVVNPKHKGKKLFLEVLKWTAQFAAKRGLQYIRLDTWAGNPPLITYYESFDFELIEYYDIPDTLEAAANCRGNRVALMEYTIAQIAPKNQEMKYMVIERFHPNKIKKLYERFDKKGRLLPEGVNYIDSWIDEKIEVCYQLMESKSLEALQHWVDQWKDLADFEIVPIVSSAEAKEKVLHS